LYVADVKREPGWGLGHDVYHAANLSKALGGAALHLIDLWD
jgi:hypothetical protein